MRNNFRESNKQANDHYGAKNWERISIYHFVSQFKFFYDRGHFPSVKFQVFIGVGIIREKSSEISFDLFLVGVGVVAVLCFFVLSNVST